MRKAHALLLLLVLLPTSVAAQTVGGPDTFRGKGFFVGARATLNPTFSYHERVYLQDFTERVEEREATTGGGGGLWLGWGFTRWLAAYGGFDLAGLGTEDYASISTNYFEAGVRLSAPTGSKLVPYVNVAYCNQGLTLDPTGNEGNVIYIGGERTSDIGGVTYGGGFQVGVLDVGFQHTQLTFREEDDPLEGSLSSNRVTVGATLWFGLGKPSG